MIKNTPSVITLITGSTLGPSIRYNTQQEKVMVKKLKKKVQRKSVVRKAENPVVDSARDIWLAGLGAFSVAQQEGEKILDEGNKFFDKLVKEGSKLEKKTRKDVEGAFEEIRGEVESRVKDIRGEVESRVKDMRGDVKARVKDIGGDFDSRFDVVRNQAESMRKQTSDNWDKLENIFDDRVGRVLARLGLPNRDDLEKLSKRVQELSRKVAVIDKKVNPGKPKAAGAKKPVAAKAAPRKAAVKKAAPKKAAVKKAAVKKAAPKKVAVKKAVAKKVALKKAAPKKAAVKKPVAKPVAPITAAKIIEKAVETKPVNTSA
jgi:poly(hydroxyalkanoate) granule-associated protein